jgi:hypothetical protein
MAFNLRNRHFLRLDDFTGLCLSAYNKLAIVDAETFTIGCILIALIARIPVLEELVDKKRTDGRYSRHDCPTPAMVATGRRNADQRIA